jgi:RNA polymerase sigma factor (TIGR02999 family)
MVGEGAQGEPGTVTRLLRRAPDDESAANELFRAIEGELRRLASVHMRRERNNHTLQTTAVVNEAAIRLLDADAGIWNDRAHFFAAASRVMRRILVDYARAQKARKRGELRVTGDATVINDSSAGQATVTLAPEPPLLCPLAAAPGWLCVRRRHVMTA